MHLSMLQLTLLGSALSVSARGLQVRQNGGSSATTRTTTTVLVSASVTSTATVLVTATGPSSAPASAPTAQLSNDDSYLLHVCFPQNSSQSLDMNAPCNQAAAIQDYCGYEANRSNGTLSPSTQQNCFCKSTFWDSFRGCNDCARLHGGPEGSYVPATIVSAASSSYCGGSATLGLSAFLNGFIQATSLDYGSATPGVDVIGNKTDVSLYYTASSKSSGAGTATTTSTSSSASGSSQSQASAGSTSGSVTAAATSGSTTASSNGPSSTGSTAGTAAAAKPTGNEAAGVRTGGALMVAAACLAYLL